MKVPIDDDVLTEWPTILPQRALDYFRLMCGKWGDVKTDLQRMGHIHELHKLLPPTATRINLNLVSETQVELVYNVGAKMYRLTCTMTGDDGSHLIKFREVAPDDSATEITLQ